MAQVMVSSYVRGWTWRPGEDHGASPHLELLSPIPRARQSKGCWGILAKGSPPLHQPLAHLWVKTGRQELAPTSPHRHADFLFEAGAQEVSPKSPGGCQGQAGHQEETSEAASASCLLVTMDTRLQRRLMCPLGTGQCGPGGRLQGLCWEWQADGNRPLWAGQSALWFPAWSIAHACFCLKSGAPEPPTPCSDTVCPLSY